MARKNGEVRDGRKLRRGNNTGTIYQKLGKDGKPTGPFYMRFCERSPEGKLVRKVWSTQTSDRDEAIGVLKKKAAELGFGFDDEAHVDALLAAKRNIENEHARLAKERAEREAAEREAAEREAAAVRDRNAISFAEAFAVYLESTKRPDSGPRTLADYERQYETFSAWVKKNYPGVEKLRDFTPSMAEAFIKNLTETRSRNTRNKYLIFLRSFWRVLRWNENAQLTIDPWEGIRTLSTAADEVIHRELTFDQLAKIAQVISSAKVQGYKISDVFSFGGVDIRDELRVLFATGIYTGLRLGDCACLSWGDIDLSRGLIDTMPRKTKARYKRRVIIPIHPVYGAILKAYAPSERKGYLLPTLADIYLNRQPSMLTNRIQAILRAAEIETVTAQGNGEKARTLAGFHSFRHTFSSIMLNAGIDSMMVEKMLGHSSDSMTARYFHENARSLALAISKLPSVMQLVPSDQKGAIELKAAIEEASASSKAENNATIDELRKMIRAMSTSDLESAVEAIQAEISGRKNKTK